MAKTASRNLTTGSPTRLVIGFLLPLLGGLLFQQLYNMVDTLVVGRFLGMDALAGVGSTSSVNFLVLGFCIGICNGFVIPVAQKFGEGDEAELRRFVANSIWLSAAFAVVLTVARTEQKAEIMRSILQKAGPDSPAQAIAFSLPTTEVAGFGFHKAQ